MEPLKITFHLKTPVVIMDMPVHLDALIAWAQTQEKLAQGVEVDNIRELAAELPFEEYTTDAGTVWKASVLVPESIQFTTTTQWVRRTDPYQITDGLEKGWLSTGKRYKPEKGYKIDTSSGMLKNHRQIYTVQMVDKMHAWCIGDLDRIEQLLLDHVRAIGAKTKMGHGQIREDVFGNPMIEVERDKAAVDKDKWKLRFMSNKVSNDYALMRSPLKPPYWDKSSAVMGWFPLNFIGLRNGIMSLSKEKGGERNGCKRN